MMMMMMMIMETRVWSDVGTTRWTCTYVYSYIVNVSNTYHIQRYLWGYNMYLHMYLHTSLETCGTIYAGIHTYVYVCM